MDNSNSDGQCDRFKLIDDRKVGPLHTKLYSLSEAETESVIRVIEDNNKLRVNGFRPGRCPAYRLYISHRETVEYEVKKLLRDEGATDFGKDGDPAVLPAEISVHTWDGKSALTVEVRRLEHPNMPNPAGRFANVMNSGSQLTDMPGAPKLPEPGAPGKNGPMPSVNLPVPQPGTAAGMSSAPGGHPGGMELPSKPEPAATGAGTPKLPS